MYNPRYKEIAESALPDGMCFWIRTWPDDSTEAVVAPAGVVPGKPIDPISLKLEIADASQWQPAWTVDHLKGKLQSIPSKEQYERLVVLNVLCDSPYSQRSGVGKDSTTLAIPNSQCTASGHQWGSIAGQHVEAIGQH
jgi:hypothetical protein